MITEMYESGPQPEPQTVRPHLYSYCTPGPASSQQPTTSTATYSIHNEAVHCMFSDIQKYKMDKNLFDNWHLYKTKLVLIPVLVATASTSF